MSDTPLPALSPRQIRFCEEYIIDHNAAGAALRAGYKQAGAKNTGCRLLQLPEVQERVAGLTILQREKHRELFERTTSELIALAFSDMGDFVGPGERGVAVKLGAAGKMRAVADIDINTLPTHTNIHLKLYDKLKALKMLAKHLGFYAPNTAGADDCAVRELLRERGSEYMLDHEDNLALGAGDAPLDSEELK